MEPVALQRPPCEGSLSWVFLLCGIISNIDRDLRHNYNLSLNEYQILATLEGGPWIQCLLAYHLKQSAAVISRWSTRLRYEGWLTRQPSSTDRREIVLAITRRGRIYRRGVHDHLRDRFRVLAADLSESERDILHRVEKRMALFMSCDRCMTPGPETETST